eukprot:scaffold9790_cov112-Skeletonema_dohrnii-CCMP3373.AAC.2
MKRLARQRVIVHRDDSFFVKMKMQRRWGEDGRCSRDERKDLILPWDGILRNCKKFSFKNPARIASKAGTPLKKQDQTKSKPIQATSGRTLTTIKSLGE